MSTNLKKTRSLSTLQLEQHKFKYLLPALLVSSISGFSTYFVAGHSVWQQWAVLSHVVSGAVLALFLIPYIALHVKRILGNRKLWVLISGVLSAAMLAAMALSGAYIAIWGQSEKLRWLFEWHVRLAFVFMAVLFFHLFFYGLDTVVNKRHKKIFLENIDVEAKRLSVYALLFGFCFILFASILYSQFYTGYKDQAIVNNYQYSYGDHPFRPSETETELNTFVDEKRIAGSLNCAECHQQIVDQWRASIHSQAASDVAYVKNINLLEKTKGIAATRYCEGCHAPVALLTGQLSPGGMHGGNEDSVAFHEGVSCMACHGVRDVVHLKGVASYRFAQPEDYLFAASDNTIATKLHNYLISVRPEQHRRDMARDVLASPKLCASCHVQFMDKNLNNWGWLKMQDEYSAWLASAFSNQTDQSFAHEEAQRCQDCHFPLLKGDDPSADEQGQIVSHLSIAANTVIPWLKGDNDHLVRTQEFLRSGKIKVTIDPPRKKQATQSKFFVEQEIRPSLETPSYYYLGDKANLNVVVSNDFVGHNFPGGTTDINEVWIDFKVTDAQDKLIYRSGEVSKDGIVDKQAHFYRSIPIDRYGKHVWKHDLFNMTGNIYKNSIPSGKSDIVEYAFDVPYWAQSPIVISAVVRYRKFNHQYGQWVLGDKAKLAPITDMASDVITVPLRQKAPLAKNF